jgi:16S rRNA (guanine527-N7)-methyltransferase
VKQEARKLMLDGARELGIELSVDMVRRFELFHDELQRWNKKVNLTALREDGEIAIKHFVDSLTVVPFLRDGMRLLDLGSGGGFPVIPLKIVRPDLDAVSVDAVEKKILFQRHAGRLLEFTRFTPLHERGERLAGSHAGGFDLIVSRAFAEIPLFAGMALPLLAPGGLIVAMKGSGGRGEVETAQPFLSENGIVVREIKEFCLPIVGDARSLVVMVRQI